MGPANKIARHGIEAEERDHQKLLDLAERFRSTTDPEEAKRLGDELGRVVFGH